MSYKTILVHVDESPHVDRRIEVAAAIAHDMGGHLIGAAAGGIAQGGDTHSILGRFSALARKLAVRSFETRLIEEDAATAISRSSVLCDLVVLGQGEADGELRSAPADFIQYVVLNCACPVLVVPDGTELAMPYRRVLIGWDGRAAAGRALRAALPLLAGAATVEVAEIGPLQQVVNGEALRNAELHAYMERHGIPIRVVHETAESEGGRELLTLAGRLASDLVVMGCVAHPQYAGPAGVKLGGATRAMLENMPTAVLMAR
ncbi:MAG: universal stress protein [Burkholderiaceae bacterium]